MSVWVRAVCRREVRQPEPEKLKEGILARLDFLFAVYEPEEDPEAAALHLAVVPVDGRPHRFSVTYRPGQKRALQVEAWTGARAKEEAQELLEVLEDGNAKDRAEVSDLLTHATQTVGIDVGEENAQSEGWPVAIAIAAFYAEQGGGLIQADGAGWLRPVPEEVRPLFVDD